MSITPAQTVTMNDLFAEVFATQIADGLTRLMDRDQSPPAPHPYVYASAARECERRMVLELTHAHQLPAYSVDTRAKFRRADQRERDIIADIDLVGRHSDPPFKVEGQQRRFELKDKQGRVCIAGKVDAQLLIGHHRVTVEVKAWSPMIVERIEVFDDVFDHPWTRSGGYQLLSYLYGSGEPYGLLILDRAGMPRVLPVTLEHHLDRVEDFLQKAERALDHVAAGTLPDYLQNNPEECKRCPFYGGTCNPPLVHQGAVVLTDPELEQMLLDREALKLSGDAFQKLDKEIKSRLRGIESAVAGPFVLEGKWGKTTELELPADIRKQYSRTNDKGRFTLTITKVNG